MAILLKEITIRYSPKGNDLFQLIKDYYAVFGLWQGIQTGGGISPGGERKAELVDDVMQQVGKMTHEATLKRLQAMDSQQQDDKGIPKTIQKLNHAASMQNWYDFTAALSEVLRQTATAKSSDEMSNIWRNAKNTEVSPSLWNLFGGRPPTPKKPKPKWKAYDKPMVGEPMPIQRDLPMAGGQMDLPLKPKEKLPQMQKDLPPLPTGMAGMAGQEPKRVGKNIEDILSGFGYNWSEADNAYKNDARNVKIQTLANNRAKAILPSGKVKDFNNLGMLLRTLGHNKIKRHGEPSAQVTKENYKTLYEFLYT